MSGVAKATGPLKATGKPALTEAQARTYLARAVAIVNAFASEGITIEGEEDPQDFMLELVDVLDVDHEDDAWQAVVAALTDPT